MEPKLQAATGRDDLAWVFMLQMDPSDPGRVVETVDSIDPRFPRGDKAVIIISTMFGCPVGCRMCDAGDRYRGNLSAEQMLAQVRFVLARRPENLRSRKLKVHFSRMGEPALNLEVIRALEQLPDVLPCAGLMPCIATVAPAGSEGFFRELLQVKERWYAEGRFQLQFSINTTDQPMRRRLIPIELMALEELAAMGRPFHRPGDRKVVLNFALGSRFEVDVDLLRRTFSPEHFMVKLTPINPTERASEHGLDTVLSAGTPDSADALVARLEEAGFDTVVSIGDADEIAIGSNCGQLVRAAAHAHDPEREPIDALV